MEVRELLVKHAKEPDPLLMMEIVKSLLAKDTTDWVVHLANDQEEGVRNSLSMAILWKYPPGKKDAENPITSQYINNGLIAPVFARVSILSNPDDCIAMAQLLAAYADKMPVRIPEIIGWGCIRRANEKMADEEDQTWRDLASRC